MAGFEKVDPCARWYVSEEWSTLRDFPRSYHCSLRESNGDISMSLAYKASVRLYWLAKKTAAPNTEFNVESQRQSVQDQYCDCLRILAMYSRTHEDPIVAYGIWGGRKRLGLKFQGRNVTIGVIKAGDIETGVTHEVKNPFELRKYLENTMGFNLANLNEEIFDRAYERLKKIEYEKKIIIDHEETKQW